MGNQGHKFVDAIINNSGKVAALTKCTDLGSECTTVTPGLCAKIYEAAQVNEKEKLTPEKLRAKLNFCAALPKIKISDEEKKTIDSADDRAWSSMKQLLSEETSQVVELRAAGNMAYRALGISHQGAPRLATDQLGLTMTADLCASLPPQAAVSTKPSAKKSSGSAEK
jgi:hypothetical protein